MTRCAYSDLPPASCAHCTGATLDHIPGTPGLAADPTSVRGVVVWPAPETATLASLTPTHPAPAHHGRPSDPTCTCGRPIHDNATICTTCSDQLARTLGDIPWLASELETTITRQRAATTEGGPPSAATAIPWHDKAADARRHLHAILGTWARLCHEEHVPHQSRDTGLPDDNLTAMSRWLLWRVDGLARHPAGMDARDEIVGAAQQCIHLIDRQPDREFVGPCECGRDLYCRPGAATVRCRGCDLEYETAQMRAWMEPQMLGLCVTLREGAGLLGRLGLPCSLNTLKSWVERKQLHPVGTSPAGHRTYRFDDLMTLGSRAASRVAQTRSAP